MFPESLASFLQAGLLGKAIDNKVVEVELIQLRDFAENKHNQVDDSPYGGGAGMVLKVEPIHRALQSIENQEKTYKILLTPRGYRLRQTMLKDWLQLKVESITLICGHYEGFDERIVEFIDMSISIGDFVLSGGEPAALILVDSIARLLPGYMGNKESLSDESFQKSKYIEYPQYTRPADYLGNQVPEVLLSGNHQEITKWRQKQAELASEKFTNRGQTED